MPFLDDIDSIKSKLHLAGMSKKSLIGLLIVFGIVIFIVFQLAWSLIQAPGVEESGAEELQIEQAEEQAEEPTTVFVHVTGCVKNPGLYELAEGARVKEAIDAAGGFGDTAATDSINLARVLTDGEQIVVADKAVQTNAQPSGDAATSASSTSSAAPGKISINTATKEELMELDGVGEVTAEKIIAYREENGGFQKIEDLMNVSGIGEKRFDAVKDSIVL